MNDYKESQSSSRWKKPLEAIRSNPLLLQAHLERVVQDHIQVAFEDL